MKASALGLLILIALALVAGIAVQVRDGELQWTSPDRVPPDPSSLQPASRRPPPRAGLAELGETVERPLFAQTRRPPPPPPPPAPPEPKPEPDPLADVVLLGLYGSGEQGGAIVRAQGKVHRVQLGQQFGGWRLASIEGRTVVLTGPRGRRNELVLKHQPQMAAPAPRQAAPARAEGQGADAQTAEASAGGAPSAQAGAAGDRQAAPAGRPRTPQAGNAAAAGAASPPTAEMTPAERRAARERLMWQRSQQGN